MFLARNAGACLAGPLTLITAAAIVSILLDALTVRIASRLSALIAIIRAIRGVADLKRFAASGLTHAAPLVTKGSVTNNLLDTSSFEATSRGRAIVAIVGTSSSQAHRATLHTAPRAIALPSSMVTEPTSTHVFLNAMAVGIAATKGAVIVIIRAIRGLAALVGLAYSRIASAFAPIAPGPIGQGDRKTHATGSASVDRATILSGRTGAKVTYGSLVYAGAVTAHTFSMVTRTTFCFI